MKRLASAAAILAITACAQNVDSVQTQTIVVAPASANASSFKSASRFKLSFSTGLKREFPISEKLEFFDDGDIVVLIDNNENRIEFMKDGTFEVKKNGKVKDKGTFVLEQ